MSKTAKTLLLKFFLTLIGSAIFFAGQGWTWVIVVAALTFVINYYIGDRLVLPALGNFIAMLGDGGMAALTAYLVGVFSAIFNPTLGSIMLFGLFVAIKEYFIHRMMIGSEEVAP